MRGQNTIIQMRLAGYKPSNVWLLLLDGPCSRRRFMDAENVIANGGQAEVHVGDDEVVGTLDLRFLTGLTVLLQGMDRDRLRLAYTRLKEFDPERIITSSADFIHDYQRAA